MISKRIISGCIVAFAVAILLLIPNKIVVGILLTLVALLAMNEYMNAIEKECKPIKWIGYLSCFIVTLINIIPSTYLNFLVMLFIPFNLLLLFLQIIVTDMKINFKDMVYTFLGVCYIPVFTAFLALINNMENGKFLLGYVMTASWGTDIAAYCVGMKIGKHKFSQVSPKKSIEGCVGGLICSVVVAMLYTLILNKFMLLEISYAKVLIFSAILSVIGQIGDFSASAIKRYLNIKDYSNLLPGHGGMLDRIDSMLFIAPFAYIFLLVM